MSQKLRGASIELRKCPKPLVFRHFRLGAFGRLRLFWANLGDKWVTNLEAFLSSTWAGKRSSESDLKGVTQMGDKPGIPFYGGVPESDSRAPRLIG